MFRLAAIELPARWADVPSALEELDRRLALKPCDLALLPEASLTGYVSPTLDFDLTRFAEPLEGPTTSALSALSKKHHVTLVGPLIERDGTRCFNSLVGFDARGARVLHYRKRHPWYPETWATPGEAQLPLVTVGDFTITCATCFDVHFLADESGEVLRNADILLFASAWVDEENTRPALLEGLARTHSITIVNANWGVGMPRVPGQGRSLIFDRDGTSIGTESPGRVDAVL